MRYLALACTLFLTGVVPALHAAPAPAKLELKPGDHVVLVGNALPDRMQHDGHFETLVVAKFPQHQLVFRNLAAAGDEVVTRHRSENFGTPDEWLKKTQADVVLAFFGYNESFKGAAGVATFKTQLADYVKHLQSENFSGKGAPRVVLFSPIANERHVDVNYPDATVNNANLQLYAAAIAEVAQAGGVQFVDLFAPSLRLYAESAKQGRSLTLNGFLLTEAGDRALAPHRPKGRPPCRREPCAIRQSLRNRRLHG